MIQYCSIALYRGMVKTTTPGISCGMPGVGNPMAWNVLQKVDPIVLKHWQSPRVNAIIYSSKIHILDYTLKMPK